MRNKFIFKLVFLFFCSSLWADYLPDYISTHVGGNFGYLNLHAGYSLQDEIFGELGYGYSPEHWTGRSIHQLSSKVSYAPLAFYNSKSWVLKPTLAVSLNIALGDQYVIFIEDQFRDYYWPSGVQVGFFAGLQNSFRTEAGLQIDLLWEAHTLLVYLLIEEKAGYLHLDEIISQSLSLRFYL